MTLGTVGTVGTAGATGAVDLGLLAAWAGPAGRMVATIGGADFAAALRAALACLVDFDTLMVTFYRGTSVPRTVYHDLEEAQALVSTRFYESGPYLLDPFYIALRNGIAPGPHLLFDLAPQGFVRSEYYRTFYRRIKLIDELGLVMETGTPDEWLVLSLARGLKSRRFGQSETAVLTATFPVIAAAALRHWREGVDPQAGFDERLSGFAADRLSPRERDVVFMILNGRSTRAMAEATGIAEGTVKVHRRHAYAKLQISSQAELFALAARYLAGDRL